MQKIKKNSRQIPSTAGVCSNKKYYDILYSYLQCLSDKQEDENENILYRYIEKKDVNFTRLGGIFGVSRQTISVKFKNLIELGLIKEEGRSYILTPLPADYAYLIPKTTLDLLNDALSENSISTYIYLFNRHLGCKEKPFTFTLEQVKTWIGVSTRTRSNDAAITNILCVLKKIGLINYSLVTQVDESNFSNVKTVYQITSVKNSV